MFGLAAAAGWFVDRLHESKIRTTVGLLPKTDLHLHLDGSLSLDFIYTMAKARGITIPCEPNDLRRLLFRSNVDPEARRTVLGMMKGSIERDGGGWLHFDFCNQFLQTEREIEAAVADLVRREYIADNAWVIEIRFCPTLHTAEGLTPQRAVGAACRGFTRGCEELGGLGNPIVGGIILCALRNLDEAHGVEMAELAAANLGRGVIGWDLAAEECPHPMSKHAAGLRRAVELGVPCTVHAGEWGSGPQTPENPHLYTKPGHSDTVPNILYALDLGTSRLGHACTLPFDRSLLRRVADSAVAIECCLSSNRRRIGGDLSAHPIRAMLDAGCVCTLNTDNRFLTDTTLTEEHVAFLREVRGTWEQLRAMVCAGARTSFYFSANDISAEERDRWLAHFDANVDAAIRTAAR